jgi:hypothetical protein
LKIAYAIHEVNIAGQNNTTSRTINAISEGESDRLFSKLRIKRARDAHNTPNR